MSAQFTALISSLTALKIKVLAEGGSAVIILQEDAMPMLVAATPDGIGKTEIIYDGIQYDHWESGEYMEPDISVKKAVMLLVRESTRSYLR